MHVLVICSIIFCRCYVAHPFEVCVYECSGCRVKIVRKPNNFYPSPPALPSKKKLIVSGPYWLEILLLVIPKLTDASHKRKLFPYHNCGPPRPCINKKAILICSTDYYRSDVFAAKDGENLLLLLLLSLLLLLLSLLLSLSSLLLLCYILLNKFETLSLPSPKAAACTHYRAFFKVLSV